MSFKVEAYRTLYIEKGNINNYIVQRDRKSKPRRLVDDFFGGGGGGGDHTPLSWGVLSAAVCFVGFLGVQ